MFSKSALAILSVLMMITGLAGVIVPFIPGVPIAWLGLFIYAYLTSFQTISLTAILVFLGLTALTMLIDFIAPILGAKKYQASKYGIIGAAVGFIVGVFTFGPFGIILGPLAGAFIGESLKGAEFYKASRSAIGTAIGFLASSLIKVIVVLIMLGYFIISLF